METYVFAGAWSSCCHGGWDRKKEHQTQHIAGVGSTDGSCEEDQPLEVTWNGFSCGQDAMSAVRLEIPNNVELLE